MYTTTRKPKGSTRGIFSAKTNTVPGRAGHR